MSSLWAWGPVRKPWHWTIDHLPARIVFAVVVRAYREVPQQQGATAADVTLYWGQRAGVIPRRP